MAEKDEDDEAVLERAAAAACCQAIIFCAVSGSKLAVLVGHPSPLTCLAWAPGPSYALTYGRDA